MNRCHGSEPKRPAARAARAGLAVATGLLAIAVLIPSLSTRQAIAQQPPREEVKRRLDTDKDTLRQAEKRAQALQTDVQQLNAEQAQINQQLIDTGRIAQTSEARLSQIELRLRDLDEQEKLLRGSLAARHERLAKLFSAMQRMGRNPPPVIVTQREDALQMVRSAMLMARAFPELKNQAEELSTRLEELVRVVTDARTEGERLRTETTRLTETRTRLATLVESKRRSVGERQKELEDVRRSAAEIARNVTELSDLVGRLDKLEKAVAERTTLGAYDRELKEREAQEVRDKEQSAKLAAAQPPLTPMRPSVAPPQAATQQMTPSANQPSSTSPTPEPASPPDNTTQVAAASIRPQPPRIALEPQAGAASNAGRMKPAIPFHLAKSQLPLPAQGRRVLAFGEKNQFGRVSRGMVIETRHGAAVVSPSDGWVVYAGEFRSYGQVLIVNAGGGYHILLANLARTDVEVGRFVLAGEPVGAMSSNVGAKTQDTAPVLYVEFRNKEGQSFDPTPWWADGSQKVQG